LKHQKKNSNGQINFIIGFNKEIGVQYIKYLTNWRLKSIGLKPIYPEATNNPLKWINKYINLHTAEKALQESEEIDYISNPVNFDEKVDVNKIMEEI